MDTRQTWESNAAQSAEAIHPDVVVRPQNEDLHAQHFSHGLKLRLFPPMALVLLAMLMGTVLLLIVLLPSLFPPALALIKDGLGVLVYLILALLLGMLVVQTRLAQRGIVAEHERETSQVRVSVRNEGY